MVTTEISGEKWAQVRHKPRSTGCVDGKTSAADIANAFGENFKSLYKSVGFDKEEMLSLMKDNETEIRRRCTRRMCDQSHCISLAEVEKAVKKTKTEQIRWRSRALYKSNQAV